MELDRHISSITINPAQPIQVRESHLSIMARGKAFIGVGVIAGVDYISIRQHFRGE